MTTSILATPNGAIGSDLAPDLNRVWFVEYSGRISRVDIIRRLAAMVSSGYGTLHGTWSFDFDRGAQATPSEAATADLFWEQQTSTERRLTPRNGAQVAWLGPVSFNSVSHADLQQVAYDFAPIDGSVGADNRLTPGTVLAVRTSAGNYAKVRVVSYGYDLGLEWRTYALDDAYAVVGTGYTEPEDIALSTDGAHAYVTERGGTLLRVDLSNANRSSSTVVSSGMTAPHQLVLDELRGVAYVVEFADSGRLLRIDLGTGARTVLANGLDHAIGLAMSADAKTAWVTEQVDGGRLVQLDLTANRKEVVLGGLGAPFFLEWADPEHSALIVVDRDPGNRVLSIPLSAAAPTAQVLLSGLPPRPSSIVTVGTRAVVCCDSKVVLASLGSSWTSTDPLLLGVGDIPVTSISVTGYATTDPGSRLLVAEAPFGGTLPLLLNHDRAFTEGARYYKILVDGVVQKDAFNDQEWVGLFNRFMVRSTAPNASGYFPVRTPASIWLDHWLGYMLDTTGLGDGLHTVEVRFYAATNSSSLLTGQSMKLQIDNTWPLVTIDEIQHRRVDGSWEAIGRCGIVNQEDNAFRLRITARDPEHHLLSWSLGVTWGDNESAHIASETYAPGAGAWEGLNAQLVPAGDPWQAIERRCAHTFRLVAWDRVINGRARIHRQEYSKSITLYLPEP